ncbi:ABC transporter permease [Pseudoflavonifractor sp. DSM 107456]|uniref:ABC transporter permease n=2 Tax=Pseudoflavonifractor TaxID=1017280 RepID=A0ABR9RA31_9FIRM|nr:MULTISPECIES: ABC transporter permease [Eubacteriales]MBC5730342.1 ABC transporter permease [Pseudoflavonifractor hominis]MBE5055560.1 ABC transporter permease [Pseudoflavonifractor gallinarum]MBS5136011.1 ABC transporter permease [Oscillospiraceae bacterium]MBT9683982.1 ABC transporter permease subunit [Pseudoflavonifractor sp. MCC625]
MAKYIFKRLLRSLLTLFIIVTIVFSLLRLMPIEGYFQNFEKMSAVQVELGLKELGLDKPLPAQLLDFYSDLLHGDLGVSNKYRRNVPVTKIIAEKVPVSMAIGLTSLGIALAVGLPMGILMARSTRTKHKIGDKLGTAFIVLIQAVPAAVYYLVIQFYGTKYLDLPMQISSGRPVTYILPILSLALGNIAYYAMWLRRYMVDESNKDYVKLARAKGVPASAISRKHVFRNAFVPLVQFIPTSVILTLMGSLYVESLYSIPGMGGLLVNVIQRQDNTVVQGLVLFYAAISILGLLVGDILMAIVDPRITFGKKEGGR